MRSWNHCDCCGQALPPEQRRELFDPTLDPDALCVCEHPYYRHFDGYNDQEPVGCKYCGCRTFQPLPDVCPACKGRGVGIFSGPGELTHSGKCPRCDGWGSVKRPDPPKAQEK